MEKYSKINNYKVLGFSSVFYGKEYERESLISIKDFVDKMYICYTRTPSHGHTTTEVCPDSEEELRTIAEEVLGDKLIWESFDGFSSEASHRDMRYKYSKDFNLILSIDFDEVFENVPAALDFAFNNKERFYGLNNYINLWRSFDYCNRDGFRPIRVENLHAGNQLQNHECPMKVYHFSTAQSEECLRYKMKIFGHASEIASNYLDDKYYAWTPETRNEVTHLHPASQDVWIQAEDFDKTTIPNYLKIHPNYNKILI